MIKPLTALAGIIITFNSFAQSDSAMIQSTFQRIMSQVMAFKPDTSQTPNDRSTELIRELRSLGGGFNINKAIQFKLAEQRQKKELTPAQIDKLFEFFHRGNGKRWLDNAVTWIYRQHFTESELEELVRFYKTPAGKKLSNDFPVIMLKSLQTAEMLRAGYKFER